MEDTFQPIPGLISCAGVTRRWGLPYHAYEYTKSMVSVPQTHGEHYSELCTQGYRLLAIMYVAMVRSLQIQYVL